MLMCTLPRSSIVLLTPDGGFNCGSVVGKRVPGTWSGVLDVFVFCVGDVRSSRHTDPGRAPGGDTIYRDTVTWRLWRTRTTHTRPCSHSTYTDA